MKATKPIELNFRKCSINMDPITGDKYLQLDQIAGVSRHEIVFDCTDFEVGLEFYGYLVENKYFSGDPTDHRCTVVNLSMSKPLLQGEEGIGASFEECSSGTGKPPTKSLNQRLREYNILCKNSQEEYKRNHPLHHEIFDRQLIVSTYISETNYVELFINDFGNTEVIFSNKELSQWSRIRSTSLNLYSKYGITYKAFKDKDFKFHWEYKNISNEMIVHQEFV